MAKEKLKSPLQKPHRARPCKGPPSCPQLAVWPRRLCDACGPYLRKFILEKDFFCSRRRPAACYISALAWPQGRWERYLRRYTLSGPSGLARLLKCIQSCTWTNEALEAGAPSRWQRKCWRPCALCESAASGFWYAKLHANKQANHVWFTKHKCTGALASCTLQGYSQ